MHRVYLDLFEWSEKVIFETTHGAGSEDWNQVNAGTTVPVPRLLPS